MEIQQRNTIETLIEQRRSVNENSDSSQLSNLDDYVDVIIQGLLSQNIAPFSICLENQITRESQDNQPEVDSIKDKILGYCRKEKSLAELSRRFLNRFQGTGRNMIALDQVTTELNVQRRRIYDIINIMESLGVVCKVKKNIYQWKGLVRAIQTIKIYADGNQPIRSDKIRKQKSLQALASDFLRLFVRQEGIISLDEAADRILKQHSDPQARKTKIRRLYDIVNVFKCMQLVEKVSISGQKSGFRWKGYTWLQKYIENKKSDQSQQSNYSPKDQQASSKQYSEPESQQRPKETKPLEAKDLKNNDDLKSTRTSVHKIRHIQNKIVNQRQFSVFPKQEDSYYSVRFYDKDLPDQQRKVDIQQSHEIETRCVRNDQQNLSYFQKIVKGLGVKQMTPENLHQKFTQIMWPQEAISK